MIRQGAGPYLVDLGNFKLTTGPEYKSRDVNDPKANELCYPQKVSRRRSNRLCKFRAFSVPVVSPTLEHGNTKRLQSNDGALGEQISLSMPCLSVKGTIVLLEESVNPLSMLLQQWRHTKIAH